MMTMMNESKLIEAFIEEVSDVRQRDPQTTLLPSCPTHWLRLPQEGGDWYKKREAYAQKGTTSGCGI